MEGFFILILGESCCRVATLSWLLVVTFMGSWSV